MHKNALQHKNVLPRKKWVAVSKNVMLQKSISTAIPFTNPYLCDISIYENIITIDHDFVKNVKFVLKKNSNERCNF